MAKYYHKSFVANITSIKYSRFHNEISKEACPEPEAKAIFSFGDPPVENLDFLLGQGNCFVHATAFKKLDVPALKSPVMLNQPIPALVISRKTWPCGRELTAETVTWVVVPEHLEFHNYTNLTDGYCPISSFFTGIKLTLVDLCNHIDFLQFTSHSRLRQCQLHVSLQSQLQVFKVNHSLHDLNKYDNWYEDILHRTNIWYRDSDLLGSAGTYINILPSAVLDLRMILVTSSFCKTYRMCYKAILEFLLDQFPVSQISYVLFEVEIRNASHHHLEKAVGYATSP